MKHSLSLTVITPVFNEEEIIESAVKTNLQLLHKSNFDFEILIVNDGSTDSSADIIDKFFSNLPEIKIFHKPVNKGFGSAVNCGIKHSTKEYILCIPADSPLTEDVLKAFTEAANEADIIVSYRIKRMGYSLRMKLNSRIFHMLVKWLFGINLRDFNWIHMYHRKIFANDGIRIRSKGLFMLAEVLVSAKRKRFTFYEIPVLQTQRATGVATASKISSVIKVLREMFVFYFSRN